MQALERRVWDFWQSTAVSIAEAKHVENFSLNLIQCFIYDSPDRALSRRLVIDSCELIFRKMDQETQAKAIKFCEGGLSADKTKQRSLSIELVKLLLVQQDVKGRVFD